MERLDTGEWREVQTAIHSDRIHGETRACTLDSDDGSTSYCTSWYGEFPWLSVRDGGGVTNVK